MRRTILCAGVTLVAVILQIVLVDRLPLPGGSGPDIPLVLVVAFGLTQGPVTGMLTGFAGGLALDLTPPASHLIGESALVFCLVGYGCGALSAWLNRSVPRLWAAALVGAATGEAALAVTGIIVSDPGVTLAAVRQVLPVAVLYDGLLCPIVLFFAALASGRLGVRRPLAGRIGSGAFRRRPRVTRQVPHWTGSARIGGLR